MILSVVSVCDLEIPGLSLGQLLKCSGEGAVSGDEIGEAEKIDRQNRVKGREAETGDYVTPDREEESPESSYCLPASVQVLVLGP